MRGHGGEGKRKIRVVAGLEVELKATGHWRDFGRERHLEKIIRIINNKRVIQIN